jgi:hypothetical protein
MQLTISARAYVVGTAIAPGNASRSRVGELLLGLAYVLTSVGSRQDLDTVGELQSKVTFGAVLLTLFLSSVLVAFGAYYYSRARDHPRTLARPTLPRPLPLRLFLPLPHRNHLPRPQRYGTKSLQKLFRRRLVTFLHCSLPSNLSSFANGSSPPVSIFVKVPMKESNTHMFSKHGFLTLPSPRS